MKYQGRITDPKDLVTKEYVDDIADTKVEYEDISTIAGTVQYDADTLEGHDADYFVPMSALADYIVEQGTSGIWTYRKWNSGIAECWGKYSISITSWSAWGSSYEGNPSLYQNYPSGLFTSEPVFTANVNGSEIGTIGLEIYSGGSASRTPSIWVLRPNSTGSCSVPVAMRASGKWK